MPSTSFNPFTYLVNLLRGEPPEDSRADQPVEVDVTASLKSITHKTQIAALVIGVVAVASAAFFLIGGILSGCIIFGILGTAAYLLIALAARDVYVITEKISNPSTWRITSNLILSFIQGTEDPSINQKLFSTAAAAAAEGTFIVKPPLIRWVFKTFFN